MTCTSAARGCDAVNEARAEPVWGSKDSEVQRRPWLHATSSSSSLHSTSRPWSSGPKDQQTTPAKVPPTTRRPVLASLEACEAGTTASEWVGMALMPSKHLMAPSCRVSMRYSEFCVPPQKKMFSSRASQQQLQSGLESVQRDMGLHDSMRVRRAVMSMEQVSTTCPRCGSTLQSVMGLSCSAGLINSRPIVK